MNSSDFLNLSMKMMDISTKWLQFFILGTVAILGWIFTSDVISSTPSYSMKRLSLCFLFLGFGITTWIG